MSAIGIYNGNSTHARLSRESKLVDKTPLTLRRHLEIYLTAAKNKMQRGLEQPTGDMWTRAWEQWKEISEQIAVLDAAVEGGTL